MQLTEKNIQTSPLILIVAALILVALTWFAITEYDAGDAVAPLAESNTGNETEDLAPPPEADD
jgi:hypothetical protein